MSDQTFADLGVSRAVTSALTERGFHSPFAIQNLVVPDVLAGRDVLAKSPTGSGKTLAFGVPIADRIEATDRRPAALILAPTRELASQIVEEMRDVVHARALSITAVYGGAGIERQIKQARKAQILVATPGRLEDLLQRRAFSLENIKILVLDEADRMLDMGFRPAVDRIVKQIPRNRQTLFFSATLEGEAGRIAKEYTSDAVRHDYMPEQATVSETNHRFVSVLHEAKVKHLVQELSDTDRGLAIVFVRTKRGADRLVKRLRTHSVEAVAMHGDKSQGQREKALARFERGEVTTLVATDVAARGIDVDGITHVINYDAPEDREGYVHRVGRTGRAGRTGTGVTFVLHDQARDVGRIAGALGLHSEFSKAGLGAAPTAGRHERGGENGRGGGTATRSRPRSRSRGQQSRGRSGSSR